MKTLLSIFMSLAITACYDPSVERTVLIMGDSIAQEVSDDFSAIMLRRDVAPMIVNNSIGGMALDFDTSREYWVGRSEAIQAIVAVDDVVISLGTNDANADTLGDYPAAIDALMATFPETTRVYWMVPTLISTVKRGQVARQLIINAEGRHANLVVVYVDGMGHDADEIHLNPEGEHEVSKYMVELMGY
jgi:hypothetical protein